MTTIRATFETVGGTEASLGTADGGAVVVDRPDGVAGGRGLGFNGGQLLALAVGGCLCNDVRYAAHARGVELAEFSVVVDVHLSDASRVTGIDVRFAPRADEGRAFADLLATAVANSVIVNAVVDGAPVNVSVEEGPAAERKSG